MAIGLAIRADISYTYTYVHMYMYAYIIHKGAQKVVANEYLLQSPIYTHIYKQKDIDTNAHSHTEQLQNSCE